MTLKTHWRGSFAWKAIVFSTKVRDETFRNGKIYEDKACFPPQSKEDFFLKKVCMGEQTFLGKFMWGVLYMGTSDQVMQERRKSFTNAFFSNLNTINLMVGAMVGDTLEKNPYQSMELWKDLTLRLMMKRFQRLSHVQFLSRLSWPGLLICYLSSVLNLKNTFCTLCLWGWGFHVFFFKKVLVATFFDVFIIGLF